VTNLGTDSRAVVRFYNKRGTAKQWIKEVKQVVKTSRQNPAISLGPALVASSLRQGQEQG